ncbi:hypothetical protein BGP_6560 [Beggiatoa sp. PS]|nr:hypothetical protein BGP_6560 [Beggiatoa sp. PS]
MDLLESHGWYELPVIAEAAPKHFYMHYGIGLLKYSKFLLMNEIHV